MKFRDCDCYIYCNSDTTILIVIDFLDWIYELGQNAHVIFNMSQTNEILVFDVVFDCIVIEVIPI